MVKPFDIKILRYLVKTHFIDNKLGNYILLSQDCYFFYHLFWWRRNIYAITPYVTKPKAFFFFFFNYVDPEPKPLKIKASSLHAFKAQNWNTTAAILMIGHLQTCMVIYLEVNLTLVQRCRRAIFVFQGAQTHAAHMEARTHSLL